MFRRRSGGCTRMADASRRVRGREKRCRNISSGRRINETVDFAQEIASQDQERGIESLLRRCWLFRGHGALQLSGNVTLSAQRCRH